MKIKNYPIIKILCCTVIIVIAVMQIQVLNSVPLLPEEQDNVHTVTYAFASFKGGEDALYKYIDTILVYPDEMWTLGVEGDIVMRFVVDTLGEVTGIRVLKADTVVRNPKQMEITEADVERCIYLMKIEATRVLAIMPLWTPTKQPNYTSEDYMTLPIRFRLIDSGK